MYDIEIPTGPHTGSIAYGYYLITLLASLPQTLIYNRQIQWNQAWTDGPFNAAMNPENYAYYGLVSWFFSMGVDFSAGYAADLHTATRVALAFDGTKLSGPVSTVFSF